MNEQSGFSGLGLLVAFVGGAVAGAVGAVLLAPKSGAETRKDIKRIAYDSADKVSRVPGAIQEAYSQGTELAKEAFTEAYKNGDKAVASKSSIKA